MLTTRPTEAARLCISQASIIITFLDLRLFDYKGKKVHERPPFLVTDVKGL
jgi:hypothetical protein